MGRAAVARDAERLLEAGIRIPYAQPEGLDSTERAWLEVEKLAVTLTRRHGQLRFLGALAVIVQLGVRDLGRLTGRSPDDIAAEHTGFCTHKALREWMAEVMRAHPGGTWSPPPADTPVAPAMALVHLHVTLCMARYGATGER